MRQNMPGAGTDAIEFITSAYPSLTDGERRIADLLIADMGEALSLSIHALAAKADVSVATVTRYAQHMGFDGYKAFRLHLAQTSSSGDDFLFDYSESDKKDLGQVGRVLDASAETIRLTKEELDHAVLEKAAKQIFQAKKLFLFGTGTSEIVCADAMLKYKRYGKQVSHTDELYAAALTLAYMDSADLLIAVSHSGQNKDTLKTLEIAKKHGIPTLAVTTFATSPLALAADMVLITKTRESPYRNIAISSRIGQFAVMDALFMSYLSLDYDHCLQNNDRVTAILKEMNII